MLRVITINLNGIRSAERKGFCLMSNQKRRHRLPAGTRPSAQTSRGDARPAGLPRFFHCADKRGYSGVGIYSRRAPDRVIEGLGNAEFDAEAATFRRTSARCRSSRSTCPPAPAPKNVRPPSTASWTFSAAHG